MVSPHPAPDNAQPKKATALRVVPDRKFIQRVLGSGGTRMRQCVQCATCSGVCELTAEDHPFPRKEMLWAQWGLKERLFTDVDLWLCHECQDCTLRCPRDARPGDVMAALRRECVTHYAVPGFVSRGAASPRNLIWFVLGSALLLAASALGWEASGAGLAELTLQGPRIVMPFWTRLPHGLLMTLFGGVVLFDCFALGVGLRRFWHALVNTRQVPGGVPAKSWGETLRDAVKKIFWHDDFSNCQSEATRQVNHTLVVWGMLGLMVVDLWVITARYNPLRSGLVYPLGLLEPWKLLANLAGLVLVIGCIQMSITRLRRDSQSRGRVVEGTPVSEGASSSLPPPSLRRSSGTYSDWLLLALLVIVVLTGFASEALHFARIEPWRFGIYAVHLVSVLTLLLVLPYSKLAHIGYRTVAILFAERYGTRRRPSAATACANEVP